jgi:hypothetical protein
MSDQVEICFLGKKIHIVVVNTYKNPTKHVGLVQGGHHLFEMQIVLGMV